MYHSRRWVANRWRALRGPGGKQQWAGLNSWPSSEAANSKKMDSCCQAHSLKQQLCWWSPAQTHKGLHTGMSSHSAILSNGQVCRGMMAAADQSWDMFVCHSPQPLHLAHHDSQHPCYLQSSTARICTYCLQVCWWGMILMLAACA